MTEVHPGEQTSDISGMHKQNYSKASQALPRGCRVHSTFGLNYCYFLLLIAMTNAVHITVTINMSITITIPNTIKGDLRPMSQDMQLCC